MTPLRKQQRTIKCGNGIVDEGEQCDCGTSLQCSRQSEKCCDPYTCKLFRNASCSNGRCCNKFQLLAKGTICRRKVKKISKK